MKERIHTLKKDEVLKQQFAHYGISELVAEVKFSVAPGDSVNDQMIKFESAVKRKVKAKYFGFSFEDKQRFIQDISFGAHKIKVEMLTEPKTEAESTIQQLLCMGAKLSYRTKYENLTHLHPAKVTITRGEKVIDAYTFLSKELTERFHLNELHIKGQRSKGSFYFADCARLFATTIAYNTLYQFADHQSDYIRYKIAEYYSQESVKCEKAILPEDEVYAAMVKQEIAKYKLPFVEGESTSADNQFSFKEYSLQKEAGIPCILKSELGKGIVIPRLIRTMSYVRDKTERMLEEHSTYAKAFQDKKHVNQKVRSVMEKNAFLSRYGKVELDNEVDLTKFRSLEKEFETIKKVVYIPNAKDYSFRIRKLGKHRAAGLHYAFYRATIIDIDHPNSYMHELGHQLDYTMNDNSMLSEMMSFVRVIQLYEKLVEKNVKNLPEGDPFLVAWFGKTKYNRDYYLLPTEIFARSFEIYLTRVKNLESSFLKENYDSPIYPNQHEFLEAIRLYFDELLSNFAPVPEVPAQSFKLAPMLVSSSVGEVREYSSSNNGQLLLF